MEILYENIAAIEFPQLVMWLCLPLFKGEPFWRELPWFLSLKEHLCLYSKSHLKKKNSFCFLLITQHFLRSCCVPGIFLSISQENSFHSQHNSLETGGTIGRLLGWRRKWRHQKVESHSSRTGHQKMAGDSVAPMQGPSFHPWSGNEISHAAPKSLNDETRDLAGHNQDPEQPNKSINNNFFLMDGRGFESRLTRARVLLTIHLI